jgi:hypothetical protein
LQDRKRKVAAKLFLDVDGTRRCSARVASLLQRCRLILAGLAQIDNTQ